MGLHYCDLHALLFWQVRWMHAGGTVRRILMARSKHDRLAHELQGVRSYHHVLLFTLTARK